MIVIIGTFRLPLENREAGREAMVRAIVQSRVEPGCIEYAYAEDAIEPGLFRVNEAWVDRAALATHFAAAHMKRWQEERAALGMTERKVIAYTISGEEAL
jgi:quinol monooxygenase YgiN